MRLFLLVLIGKRFLTVSSEQPQLPHVKVTINDLYKEQQETNKLLIQLASELKGLSDLPGRVGKLEVAVAESSWVGKLVWAAVSSGIIGLVTSVHSIVRG